VGAIGRDPNEVETHPLDLMFMLMAKEVFGTIFGHNVPRIDIPRLLALYRDGKLKLDELVTRRYRLEEINQAYHDVECGQVIRGVLVFD
jgi:S-(hydroxymethyl)glutathione dehydrogenase/alcohol dehydrogenase